MKSLVAIPGRVWRRFRQGLTLVELLLLVVFQIAFMSILQLLIHGDQDPAHRYPPPSPKSGSGFAPVAGEYEQAGANLSILADGRYSRIFHSCSGIVARESGTVMRAGETLVLTPIKAPERRREQVFRPVKWGMRSYLIPPERLEAFCDSIMKGDEPTVSITTRGGPLHWFETLGTVSGIPELPEPWMSYLRDNRLIATNVEALQGGRARLDVGSAQGIRVGHILEVQGHSYRQALRVDAVTEHSCEVVEDHPDEAGKPIESRWQAVVLREPNP